MFDLFDIFLASEKKTTIWTPTRRLASYLTDLIVQRAVASGQQVVERPFVQSLQDAALGMFEQLQLQGDIKALYLSPPESLLLFENMIQNSSEGEGILKLTGTAKLVWQAWQTLRLWQVELDRSEIEENWLAQGDLKAFYHWAHLYRRQLDDQNWVDQPGLWETLITQIDERTKFFEIAPRRRFLLYGFDDIPPAQQAFLEHLKTCGWEELQIDFFIKPGTLKRYEFQTVEQEFQAATRWAQDLLLQDPSCAIAIVVPELPRYRVILEKKLLETFHPEALLYPEPIVSEFYNISAGQPLNTIPIVYDALSKLSKLSKLSNFGPERKNLSYFDWMKQINQYLIEQDWPGQRPLNSIEHQAVKQWIDLLIQFSKLDRLFEPTNYGVAFKRLKHLAQDIPFQPQSRIVRLHVLGVLEAAGQHFTHLWLTGLNDIDWPSVPNPNPFLPMALQVERNMPHATHERQCFFTEKMMQRLLGSAKNIHLSYAQRDKNQFYAPSALFGADDIAQFSRQEIKKSVQQIIFKSAQREDYLDIQGPALGYAVIPGATKTLKLQACCPFKAFAEVRLKLTSAEAPVLGLALKERGILIHGILESLWGKIKTQKTLLAYTKTGLNACIQSCIFEQVACMRSQENLKSLGNYFWEREVARLSKIVHLWLDLEKMRSDFEVIAREAYYELEWGDHRLKICIDRVDRLSDGSLILIDYKTSLVSLSGLLDSSLLEPQLPLYCFTARFPNPVGIFFGQVRSDQCRFLGLSCSEISEDRRIKVEVRTEQEWFNLLAFWKKEIDLNIKQFKQGYAAVLPIDRNKICRNCHLKNLCRVREIQNV